MLPHDLWLIPPAATGEKALTVRAVQGTKFPTGDRAPDPAKLTRRVVVGPDGKEAKLDAGGTADKAGLLRFEPTGPGVYAVAVEATPKVLEMTAADFNRYLVSGGLLHVYLQRAMDGMLDRPARERYSKSPKALLRVVAGGPGDPTRPVGLPLLSVLWHRKARPQPWVDTARLLPRTGPTAAAALMEQLTAADLLVRMAAAEALLAADLDGKAAALEVLTELTKQRDYLLPAARAMARVGPPYRPAAVAALVVAAERAGSEFRDNPWTAIEVRQAAVAAIREIDPQAARRVGL